MTAPNMATITESLERSLQNCSLNHERRNTNRGGGGGGDDELIGKSSTLDENTNTTSSGSSSSLPITVSDTSLDLNSHLSLPYHWEQCLDLKSGEIYYINWRNGKKAWEDPRIVAQYSREFYSEEEEDDDDDDANSSYDSEVLSSESSSPCSTRKMAGHCNNNNSNNHHRVEKDKDNVLVVAGCKSCFMYFMVPKHVEDCPKCNSHLLHFDQSESTSP